MKPAVALLLLLFTLLTLSACRAETPGVPPESPAPPQSGPAPEPTPPDSAEEQTPPQDAVATWEEITPDGVDEELLADNIDAAVLERIASEFQTLCEEIAAKEEADPDYVLRGGWVQDIPVSRQYLSVISLGDSAMKPLYLIVYKSENQGLYEYICCLALEELSGYDLVNEYGDKWSASKEFLTMFNKAVTEEKSDREA